VQGTEQVGDRRAFVVTGSPPEGERPLGGDHEIATVTLYVDAETYDLLGFAGSGVPLEREDGGAPAAIDMRLLAYDLREVDGLVVPHRFVVNGSGMLAALPQGEVEQARAALGMMRGMLHLLEGEERTQAEWMLPMLDQLLSTGGMEVELRVRDVRVNTGQ
jgi:hypothetical protein